MLKIPSGCITAYFKTEQYLLFFSPFIFSLSHFFLGAFIYVYKPHSLGMSCRLSVKDVFFRQCESQTIICRIIYAIFFIISSFFLFFFFTSFLFCSAWFFIIIIIIFFPSLFVCLLVCFRHGSLAEPSSSRWNKKLFMPDYFAEFAVWFIKKNFHKEKQRMMDATLFDVYNRLTVLIPLSFFFFSIVKMYLRLDT